MSTEELRGRAREWLSRESATNYFTYGGYCKDDQAGMLAELTALLEQVAAEAALKEHELKCAHCKYMEDLTRCERGAALAKQSGRG